ncbi:MAG: hypothetical protein V4687_16520 [Bacteroidota bacterium]
MKKQTLLLIIFLLASVNSIACVCGRISTAENFKRASFVATIKLIKITPDLLNSNYHNAEVEIINLYKGEALKTIKIASVLKSSCKFLPPENSTWLVFASTWEGVLSFGYCTSTLQSSGGNELELLTVDYLKEHNITDPNPSQLVYSTPYDYKLKYYNNRNKMAVYRVDVNAGLSIGKIKSLQRFDNNRLNTAYLKILRKGLKITKSPALTKPTYLIIFCYHAGSNPERTFLSY